MKPILIKQITRGRPLAACLLFAAGQVVPLHADEPAWWAENGVQGSSPKSDYSPITAGQVKHLAAQAKAAMDANFFEGAGPEIDALISGWESLTAPNDYNAVTLGQLKNVSKLFYDRLAEDGLVTPELYPWTSVYPKQDYAMAAIGQAKRLFSFDVSPQMVADFHLYRVKGNASTTVAQDVPVHVTSAAPGTLEYEVVVAPQFGTLDETNAPDYTYQPLPGFEGADFFVYKAKAAGSDQESNPAQVSLLVGEYPDEIKLVHPAHNKQIVEGDGVAFVVDAFKAAAKVTSVEFYEVVTGVGDVKIGSAPTDTLDSFTWLNATVGTHYVKSKAYFDDSTTATSATHTIQIVTNAAPAISLSLSPNPNGQAAPRAANSITMKAIATDATPGDKVKRVQFFLDGELLGEDFTPATTPANQFDLNIPDKVWGGSHTVIARAVDTHGKTAEAQTIFTVTGNKAPVVAINSPVMREEFDASPGPSGTADIDIEIQATDPESNTISAVEVEVTSGGSSDTYTATLDGSVYRVTLEDKPPGTYYLRASATDSPAGAVGKSTTVKCLVIGDWQVPPSDLLDEITGENITTANLDFIGKLSAATKYQGGRYFSIESNSGVLLTSGKVKWKGPNNDDATSENLYQPGDDDLRLLVVDDNGGNATYDATGLEFNFTPTKSKVEVVLQFASEEYNEYSPTGGEESNDYNDLFAMYVDGVNIARVPGTRAEQESPNSKIGVDSINSLEVTGADNDGDNRHLYCTNDPSETTPEVRFKTEYDGFTFKVTAMAAVTPNQSHHMKIVIADAIDEVLDSGLFIKSASFRSVDP